MELRRKPVCSRKVIENQELVVEKDKWKVYSENRNRKKREERRKNRVKREKLKKIQQDKNSLEQTRNSRRTRFAQHCQWNCWKQYKCIGEIVAVWKIRYQIH